MPKKTDTINRELFDLLSAKNYDPESFDASGKRVPVPEDAEVIQFTFTKDGESYGTATVTIDGTKKMIVYFSDAIANSPKADPATDDELSWAHLLRHLKKFAHRNQLTFRLKNTDKLGSDMAKREHTRKQELAESYFARGSRESWSDAVPQVKIKIKHTRPLDETEARHRQIDKIFVENAAGERFLLPTRRLSEARAYARHIAEGGKPGDDRFQHIKQICEERGKLRGFMFATRNHVFEGEMSAVVTEAYAHYESLGKNIRGLSSHRGYTNYFESWQPEEMITEMDDDMRGHFVNETIDDRIVEAMPILHRIRKGIVKPKTQVDTEIEQLDEWADSIIYEAEETPETKTRIAKIIDIVGPGSSELALGPNGINAKGALEGILDDTALFDELDRAADRDPDQDARHIVIDWLSDNRRENKTLDRMHDAIVDAMQGKETPEVPDEEPEKPAPETEMPAQAPAMPPPDMSQLPPLPPPPAGLPPPPAGLPPLAESEIARILQLSGIKK